MPALFREEALRACESECLGTIRIGCNPSFEVVAVLAAVLVAALVAYAAMGEVTRKARLPGLLVPAEGTLNLSAPQSGMLVDILVHEGDEVAADEVLMVVRIDRSTALGDAAALIAQNLEQRRVSLET